MTNEKKLVIKRIIIFIILAFGLSYPMQIFGTNENAEVESMIVSVCLMFPPAIANFLTRIITKEGMSESYLRINFKGNSKIYLTAFILPIIIGIVSAIAIVILFADDYSFSDAIESVGGGFTALTVLLMSLLQGLVFLHMGFGEEFGWRAYLTPKLEKLMPTPLAVIFTGIIWGLWHAPLISRGYDFGRDYAFFPAGGIIAMCVGCVMISFILTWLTKKTGSVWPAAIWHIVYDMICTPITAVALGEKYSRAMTDNYFICACIIMIFVPAVTAAVISLPKTGKSRTE